MRKILLIVAILFSIIFVPFASASFVVENEIKEADRTFFVLRNDNPSSYYSLTDNVIPPINNYENPEKQLCKRFESPYENYNNIYEVDLYGFDNPQGEYPSFLLRVYSDENARPNKVLYSTRHGGDSKMNNGAVRWNNLSVSPPPSAGKFFWVCIASTTGTGKYGHLKFNDGNPDNTDYYFNSNGNLDHLSRTYAMMAKIVTPAFNEQASNPTPPEQPPTATETVILKNENAASSIGASDNVVPWSGQLCKSFTLPKPDLSLVDVEVVGLDGGAQTFNLNIYNDNGSGKPGANIGGLSKFNFEKNGLYGKLPTKLSIKPNQNFFVCLSSLENYVYGFLRFDDGSKNTDFILSNGGQWNYAPAARTYSIRAHVKEGISKPVPTITFADKPSIGACGAFLPGTILIDWTKKDSCPDITTNPDFPLVYFYRDPIAGSGCNNGLNAFGETSNCFLSPSDAILPPPKSPPPYTDVTNIDCKMGLSKTCMVTPPVPPEPPKYYTKIEARETSYSWDVLESQINALKNDLKSIDITSLSDEKIKELSKKIAPIAQDIDRANSIVLDCDKKPETRNPHIDADTNRIITSPCIDEGESKAVKMRAIDMEKNLIFAFRDFSYRLDPKLRDLHQAEQINQAVNTFFILTFPISSELKILVDEFLEVIKTTTESTEKALKVNYFSKCGFDLHKTEFNTQLSKGNTQWLKSSDGTYQIIKSIMSCVG